MENRMSPNQSGAAPQDGVSKEGSHSGSAIDSASLLNNIVVYGEEGGYRTDKGDVGDDPMLTTDCPSYGAAMNNIPKIFPPRKEDHEGSDASTPSQKITIESIKGNSDDEFEDDRSSVVTESSLSDRDEHVEGNFHEGLKRSANTLAVDAINCASDELQGNGNNVICVKSELRPDRSSNGAPSLPTNGGVNNGYVMSEVGKPSRRRDMKRNGKELVLSEPGGEIVPSTATTMSPLGQQTTAIFNESTDITLGNKTFITGSLTIKQYIKDSSSAPRNQTFWESLSPRKKVGIAAGATGAVLALITLVVLLTVLSNGQSTGGVRDGDDGRQINPSDSKIDDDQTSQGSVLRVVSRGEWVAQPANDELANLKLPVNRVIIAHTATEACTSQSECVFRVRYIQNFHIESQNFSDIGYNFLVGGDGAVYEGRGWNKQGAHTRGYNVGSVCVAFIGTFTRLEPSARQLNVTKLLLEEGVRLNKLTKSYNLFGARQFFGTESPGERLFRIIKAWPHWKNEVE